MTELDESLYRSLNASERFMRGLVALGRNDTQELRLLGRVGPVVQRPDADPAYFERMRSFNELAACTGGLVWRHIAESRGDNKRQAVLALRRLKGTLLAWEALCSHIGVPADSLPEVTGYLTGRALAERHQEIEADANAMSGWLELMMSKWDGTVAYVDSLSPEAA